MSEQLLKQLLHEMKDMKSNMSTKQDIESLNKKLDQLSEKVSVQHVENINADNLLLNEIKALRENIVFVNRKVADTELEVNLLKHKN